MSASDNLSNELFFEAHRGLREAPSKDYGLGMHWSANENVARKFAGGTLQPHDPNQWSRTDMNPVKPHTVIHANVPISSIETNAKVLGQHGVFNSFSQNQQFRGLAAHEQEVSVKQGAPVFVTGVTKFRQKYRDRTGLGAIPGISKEVSSKPRTRTYNPPREMKA